ncbi:hypothetical protein LTR37_008291 [Vermiconidia calcicola]|uniref:Uncharacterized protein n=1 Tax=Vermiconidia calcicola TaxID=1690605 RepID=A0ACC3NCG8_9PEZI|nr:hypothetical protein LTR37_008291 [Vermiconidia calcicola]
MDRTRHAPAAEGAKGQNLKQNADSQMKKVKIWDSMLSAFDRKKKRNLPPERKNLFQATQDPSTDSVFISLAHPHLNFVASKLVEANLPKSSDAEASLPNPRNAAAPREARVAETQNLRALATFFNDDRATPAEQEAAIATPRSEFEWDDSDEEDNRQVSSSFAFPQHLRRHRKAPAHTETGADESAVVGSVKVDGKGQGGRAFTFPIRMLGGSRANAFKEQAESTSSHRVPIFDTARDLSDSRYPTGKPPVKRSSVLKLFDDPIWDGSIGRYIGNCGATYVQLTMTDAQGRVGGRDLSGASTGGPGTADRSRKSRKLATSTSMPLLNALPPRKQDVGPGGFSDVEMSTKGYRHVNWSQHGRGMSVFNAPECVPSLVQPSTTQTTCKGPEKKSVLKKLKAELNIGTPEYALEEEHSLEYETYNGIRVPKFGSTLRTECSANDIRAEAELEASLKGASREQSIIKSVGISQSIDSESNAPNEKIGRRRRAKTIATSPASTERTSGKHTSAEPSPMSRFSPATLSTATSMPSPLRPSQDVCEPDWNRTMTYVKLNQQKREAYEAALGTSLNIELTEEEKKLQRIKAGKDVILRSSQLGLSLKKPIEAITEDDFETVGCAATGLDNEASILKKSNVLGGFFTKTRGNKQDLEHEQSRIGNQIKNHVSLRRLDNAGQKNVNSPTEQQKAHYDNALRLLHGDGYEEYELISPFEIDEPRGLGISTVGGEIRSSTPQSPSQQVVAISPTSTLDDTTPRRPVRPMTTIAESVSEDPDGARPGSPEMHVKDLDSSSSLYSMDDEPQTEDALSEYSFPDAVPPPLNVQKDIYPPSRIPVLKSIRSCEQISPTMGKSFSPKRDTMFWNRIQATSRLQEAKVGSHPALRQVAQNDEPIIVMCSPRQASSNSPKASSEHDRVDSGIGMGSDESPDVDYGTGMPNENESKIEHLSGTTKAESPNKGQSQHWQATGSSSESNSEHRWSGDIDLQALRSEVGLGPATIPAGLGSPTHPNHPFSWNHEKVMCRNIHSPVIMQPELPAMPLNTPVIVSRMDSKFFNTGPSKNSVNTVKTCDQCSTPCCRYASLLRTSTTKTSRDIAVEVVRLKAEERVNMLRVYHPNGIEEYDTFMTCAVCSCKICPGCANKCAEGLCQSVVCVKCSAGAEGCPVHHPVY